MDRALPWTLLIPVLSAAGNSPDEFGTANIAAAVP